ncbi:MAG: FtsX-like permease family protein [Fusobacteriaceae bacterium]|nr:FtsX-like permease family protein [Fusobacteriaceae bacterium]MBN2837653.1 FtsX-like permease family protein [Fusobacteriaceae bacterium]
MNIIFKVSLRNLLRQKRRNFLLGIGIAFGMSILVIASSFSQGLVDVLIKDLISSVAGHVQINGNEKSKRIIRDKEPIYKVINKYQDKILRIDESVGAYTRIIGNGNSINAPIVGVKNQDGFFGNYLRIISGDTKDFDTNTFEYPIIISPDKAKSLKVKVGDVVKAKFTTVTGQIQAVNMQVIAIATTNSSFTDFVLYMDVNKMRTLLGYRPWESGPIQIVLNNPKKDTIFIADEIRNEIKPELLKGKGTILDKPIEIYAFKKDDKSIEKIFNEIKVVEGEKKEYTGKKGFLISESLKEKLGIKLGDKVSFKYISKYSGEIEVEASEVNGVFQSTDKFKENFIFLNGEKIYKIFNEDIPKDYKSDSFTKADNIYDSFAKNYELLEKAKTSEELDKLKRLERAYKSDRPVYSVETMYETAERVLAIQYALSLITWLVGLILFFIILIGVVNTLRMTIKERTIEIGTLRAIGMQAGEVKKGFILESILLTLVSCVFGIIFGIVAIKILGSIEFDSNNPLSFILKNRKIYFRFSILSTFFQIVILTFVTGITAYFPAKRASKINPNDALRHVE